MKKVSVFILIVLFNSVNAYPQVTSPEADHHVHVRSAAATKAGYEWIDATSFNIDEKYKAEVLTADKIIKDLNEASIDKALLLSSAFYFTAPEVEYEDEQQRVENENNWTANQAKKSDRLAFACSVSPLSEYAIKEVQRCANKLGARAVKLHFFYSDIKIQKSAHLKEVKRVVKEADQQDLHIVIHLETRAPYIENRENNFGAQSVEKLIKVLSPYPRNVKIQFAHLAIGSTPSTKNLEEIKKLAQILDKHDPDSEQFILDTSYAIIPSEIISDTNKEALKYIKKANPKMGKAMRILGLERLVFGSDALDPGQIQLHVKAMSKESGLSAKIINQIFDNVVPIF